MPETFSTGAEHAGRAGAEQVRRRSAGGSESQRPPAAPSSTTPGCAPVQLAARHELLAADEDVLDALGAHDVAGRAAREIVHLLRRARLDPGRIEADDVVHLPARQEPALRDAADRRPHRAQPPHRLLPAEEAALAHPAAE